MQQQETVTPRLCNEAQPIPTTTHSNGVRRGFFQLTEFNSQIYSDFV